MGVDLPAVRAVSQRIADYALVGDCHGAALVGRDGSVDWWCAPRFDSRSAFARLLDPEAGHWAIRPVGAFEVERAYVPGTMVLRTTFHAESGTLAVTDALALGPGARGHDLGQTAPHVLLRVVEALDGVVQVEVEFVPRLEYGLVQPALVRRPAGLQTLGGADTLLLSGDRELDVKDGRAVGTFALRRGESAAFGLHHSQGTRRVPPRPLDARAALEDTTAAWRSWSELHEGYQGPYREQVLRSALVLQALTYAPSGAIVAAPTTSLPEEIGGQANWDYRFAWLRDASLTLKALWVGACPDEAGHFFDWMANAARAPHAGGHVQIMFGVEGERDLTEHTLDHLRGYRDSAPVRVGNDAWSQRQLDVLGEVLEGAWVLRDQLGDLEPLTAAFLGDLADRAAASWRETDAGIWEARDAERHYLTSKLLCWVALDRAIKLAPQLGEQAAQERWGAARDEVRRAILERGWNDEAGAYTGAFGSDRLDAGVLLMAILGFLAADDERMLATIDAIERDLSHDGLVQRWSGAGDEGSFVICSYWLAQCRALAGQTDRAHRIFETVTAHANDLGLLAEEIDLRDGELIGNFPQALSHIGLINAAWALHQAHEKHS
jgi:GH15 family glucan-1,4-alpha-glucosidase